MLPLDLRIKHYEEFVNEWEKRPHYIERTTPSDIKNRIVPYTPNMKYGWKLSNFIEVDSEGDDLRNKITLEEFIEKSGKSLEEINEKIVKSLRFLTWSKKIPNHNLANNADFHVYLGKLVFPVSSMEKDAKGGNIEKTLYFSPILETDKGKGNEVWAGISRNKGITVLYLRNPSDNELQLKGYNNRSAHHEDMHFDDYVKQIYRGRASLHSENFYLLIPDTENWEEEVAKSADTGVVIKGKSKVSVDYDEAAWKMLMIEESVTIFDKGTKLVEDNGIRTVTGFLEKTSSGYRSVSDAFAKNVTHYTYILEDGKPKAPAVLPPIGSTVNILTKEDKKVRTIGSKIGKIDLSDGLLVKVILVESYIRSKGKRAIFGSIQNYTTV